MYGYRRPPHGTRGCISEDGVTWEVKTEFNMREGGVPGATVADTPGSSRMMPETGKLKACGIDWANPRIYQYIGDPSVAQMADGTILAAYFRPELEQQLKRRVQGCRLKSGSTFSC